MLFRGIKTKTKPTTNKGADEANQSYQWQSVSAIGCGHSQDNLHGREVCGQDHHNQGLYGLMLYEGQNCPTYLSGVGL